MINNLNQQRQIRESNYLLKLKSLIRNKTYIIKALIKLAIKKKFNQYNKLNY